jgi:hypothetical protein
MIGDVSDILNSDDAPTDHQDGSEHDDCEPGNSGNKRIKDDSSWIRRVRPCHTTVRVPQLHKHLFVMKNIAIC